MLKARRMVVVAMVGLLAALSGCERHMAPSMDPDIKPVDLNSLRADLNSGGDSTAAKGGGPDVEPTGWASIEGTVKLIGTAPAMGRLRAAADAAICAPGGAGPKSQALVVENGNIANVLLYLTTEIPTDDDGNLRPKWVHPDYDATKEDSVVFDQKGCIFLSHVFAMRSTQKMKIINSDPIGHNTTLQPRGDCTPFGQLLAGNTSVVHSVLGKGKVSAQEKSPFPVVCNVHPWMRSYMITRDDPYFAVTGKQGNFKIENLPATADGLELEFTVWHESAGFLKQITVNGKAVKLKRGRYTIALKPGEDQNLNIEIDLSAFKL